MDDYPLATLERDLAAFLKPHRIGVRVVEERLNELSIQTWRQSGSQMSKVFTVSIVRVGPALAVRMRDLILNFYEQSS